LQELPISNLQPLQVFPIVFLGAVVVLPVVMPGEVATSIQATIQASMQVAIIVIIKLDLQAYFLAFNSMFENA
jgi:hypothetical protein